MEKRISLLESGPRDVLVAVFLGFGLLALAGGAWAQKQQGEKKESPFYCNIKTLSVAERLHKKQIGEKMAAARVEVNELPNGFAFGFRPGGVSIVELADWVESEQRCCPFFDMTIETEREGGPVWLKITGREGVKEFIREELKSLKAS